MHRWKGHVSRQPLWGTVEFTLAWHVVLVLLAEVVLPPMFRGRLGHPAPVGMATPQRGRGAGPALVAGAADARRGGSYAVAGIEGSTTVVASALVSLLWVSISEEIYSRGLVQQVLTRLGPMRSAIGVGFLFGVGHLQNYLFFDAPLDDTLWQMLSAALFGFACAGLRFAIGSVWPMVVVHGLDDFFQIRSPGAAPDWWQVSVYVFPATFGVWLLRRYGTEDAPVARSIRADPDERPEQVLD